MRTKAECAVKTLPSPVAPSKAATIWTVVANSTLRIARAINHRIAVNSMSNMDEHLLRDIGLTKGDVHRALGASIGDDPSHELTRSAVANAKNRFNLSR